MPLTTLCTEEDRCFEENELRNRAPVDKVLKAEIYKLLNDADCGKVTTLHLFIIVVFHLRACLCSLAHVCVWLIDRQVKLIDKCVFLCR